MWYYCGVYRVSEDAVNIIYELKYHVESTTKLQRLNLFQGRCFVFVSIGFWVTFAVHFVSENFTSDYSGKLEQRFRIISALVAFMFQW